MLNAAREPLHTVHGEPHADINRTYTSGPRTDDVLRVGLRFVLRVLRKDDGLRPMW